MERRRSRRARSAFECSASLPVALLPVCRRLGASGVAATSSKTRGGAEGTREASAEEGLVMASISGGTPFDALAVDQKVLREMFCKLARLGMTEKDGIPKRERRPCGMPERRLNFTGALERVEPQARRQSRDRQSIGPCAAGCHVAAAVARHAMLVRAPD